MVKVQNKESNNIDHRQRHSEKKENALLLCCGIVVRLIGRGMMYRRTVRGICWGVYSVSVICEWKNDSLMCRNIKEL
jgi:hypothetical protein